MVEHFTLPDGRNLDYLISGDAEGFPFVFIHGTPGSYPTLKGLADAGKQKGIKIITLSRAGYGGSTRHRGRRVIDDADDVRALLGHLGHSKCVVGGWSGGGPLALACAARLPGCVAALCVASPAPFDAEGLDFLAGQGQANVEEWQAALRGEDEIAKFCEDQRLDLINIDPESLNEAMSSLLSPVDKKAIAGSEMGEVTCEMFKEGLKNTADGWVDDDLRMSHCLEPYSCSPAVLTQSLTGCAEMLKPWGFEFDEIKVPVFLYQGTEDFMCPPAHGKWLLEHLPQGLVQKHLMEGEGHVSIFLGQMDKMIDDLMKYAK